MSDSNQDQTSTVHGSGQSVNIVLSHGSVKWIVIALLALVVMLFLTNRTSVGAELKANQAIKASEDMQTEYRITQVWAQRVSASCEQVGIRSPLPAALAN